MLGPMRIADTLRDLDVTPHLVAVSTCYVAGNRRGKAPEQLVDESPFFVDVDWRKERDGARRARRDAEAESRTPEKLAEFRKRVWRTDQEYLEVQRYGGILLVRPLVDEFGVPRALAYMAQTPFHVESDNLRASAMRYQDQARDALRVKAPPYVAPILSSDTRHARWPAIAGEFPKARGVLTKGASDVGRPR